MEKSDLSYDKINVKILNKFDMINSVMVEESKSNENDSS